jgi:hypothetical protein
MSLVVWSTEAVVAAGSDVTRRRVGVDALRESREEW